MTTHQRRIHGGPTDGLPALVPSRVTGLLERRVAGRGRRAARGSASTAPRPADRGERKPVYWLGDDRETTHGDW